MPTITKIAIPQPCHQQWNQMTEADNGRFCASCAKTVIDFTAMTDQQVIAYLSAADHKTCGRFNQMQVNGLNRKLQTHHTSNTGWWKNALMALTMLSATHYVKAQTVPVKANTEQSQGNIKVDKIINDDVVAYRKVTGVITDAKDHLPLPGVSIKVTGTNIGTQTDTEGRFVLNVPENAKEIAVTFIGYTIQHVSLNSTTTEYKIALDAAPALLGEVVIVKKASFVKRVYYRYVWQPRVRVKQTLNRIISNI